MRSASWSACHTPACTTGRAGATASRTQPPLRQSSTNSCAAIEKRTSGAGAVTAATAACAVHRPPCLCRWRCEWRRLGGSARVSSEAASHRCCFRFCTASHVSSAALVFSCVLYQDLPGPSTPVVQHPPTVPSSFEPNLFVDPYVMLLLVTADMCNNVSVQEFLGPDMLDPNCAANSAPRHARLPPPAERCRRPGPSV